MQTTPSEKRVFHRRLFLLCSVLGAAAVLVLWLFWRSRPDPAFWLGLLEEGRLYLETRPWALVLALAVLPGLGFPLSPLLVLFGMVLGPRLGMPAACALGILAQSLCSAWAYWAAAGPFRGLLQRFVLRDRRLPSLAAGNALQVGFFLRITPGIPYALQNVALGLIGLPFGAYLLVSIPVQSLYTVGFIVTGGAIFEGRAGLALSGIALLIALILATRLLRKRRHAHAG
jgi:uncharacterized membrane protein YdjX (TVP38/TMEM64 family)